MIESNPPPASTAGETRTTSTNRSGFGFDVVARNDNGAAGTSKRSTNRRMSSCNAGSARTNNVSVASTATNSGGSVRCSINVTGGIEGRSSLADDPS